MTRPPRELLEFLYRYDPAEIASCHEYIFEMRSKVVLLYGICKSSSTWTRVRLRNLTFIKGRSAGSLPMAWTAVSQQAFGRWDYQPSRAMKTALHHKLAQRLILSILSS